METRKELYMSSYQLHGTESNGQEVSAYTTRPDLISSKWYDSTRWSQTRGPSIF
ncbi:hypothetical protein VFPPC_15831 [Pochonia chlamydosporia 170]|uniref:Uncharacterized protein n=1 Tax=Pochonia chlamydosporia 170 TaxID=1380566 RepID=A0A179FTQ8_METCM|nr:hypothetical protein VFPPC_15831 [Pochonia chlamydosporia 170]OAQ68473.1 hypothetical protein VFPPC_15831 [Pochonia chlamydosporia 170]